MVNKLMAKLGCTEAEALEIIAFDKAVDRGADPYKLTAEQQKVAKKMCSTGTRAKTESKPKTHKKDEEKAQIITNLADFLANYTDFLAISNPERQISFKIGENSYELTLVKKRK